MFLDDLHLASSGLYLNKLYKVVHLLPDMKKKLFYSFKRYL